VGLDDLVKDEPDEVDQMGFDDPETPTPEEFAYLQVKIMFNYLKLNHISVSKQT